METVTYKLTYLSLGNRNEMVFESLEAANGFYKMVSEFFDDVHLYKVTTLEIPVYE